MIKRLKLLGKQLKRLKLSQYSLKIDRIIKICSMPGIDYPTEETDVEGIDDVLEYLKENPGKFIFLDNPKNSYKRFGQKQYRKMPFHYGEFVEINNPADDMGWDIILVPSANIRKDESSEEEGEEDSDESRRTSEGTANMLQYEELKKDLAHQEKHPVDYVPAGHNFIPVGYVPVNDDQEEWTKRTKTSANPRGKKAPAGNDKIILAPDGEIKDEDKASIEEFFGSMWNFKDVVWL